VRRGHELVTALGGFDAVTPQQLVLVDQVVQAGVIRDACFALLVRDGTPVARAAERFQGAANVERTALSLLGLERVAKPVKGLDLEALRERVRPAVTVEAQPVAAPAASGTPNGSDLEPALEPRPNGTGAPEEALRTAPAPDRSSG
jgi:hypothetical protein